jgi:hypothetical protein
MSDSDNIKRIQYELADKKAILAELEEGQWDSNISDELKKSREQEIRRIKGLISGLEVQLYPSFPLSEWECIQLPMRIE